MVLEEGVGVGEAGGKDDKGHEDPPAAAGISLILTVVVSRTFMPKLVKSHTLHRYTRAVRCMSIIPQHSSLQKQTHALHFLREWEKISIPPNDMFLPVSHHAEAGQSGALVIRLLHGELFVWLHK